MMVKDWRELVTHFGYNDEGIERGNHMFWLLW